jgi:hypothetical protein
MKVYMHWDIEGVSGLFTREHVWFWEVGFTALLVPRQVREHLRLVLRGECPGRDVAQRSLVDSIALVLATISISLLFGQSVAGNGAVAP